MPSTTAQAAFRADRIAFYTAMRARRAGRCPVTRHVGTERIRVSAEHTIVIEEHVDNDERWATPRFIAYIETHDARGWPVDVPVGSSIDRDKAIGVATRHVARLAAGGAL